MSDLRDYQALGARWLRSRASAVLADEMRLGKSAQALRALESPAIVLCPASARHVWAAEIRRWRPDLRADVSAPGEFRLPSARSVAVSTYDALPVPEERARGRWLVPFDLGRVTLVLDEAHLLKNAAARRTQRVRVLAAQCARVWGLTGTPLAGYPPDLWGVLASCRLAAEAFGSFDRFAALCGGRVRVLPPVNDRGKQRRFWEWPAAALPSSEVRERLSRVSLRRLRREVAPSSAVKETLDVPLDPTPEIEAELDRVGWPDGAELPPLEEFSAVRARVAAARIPALLERVQRFEETWQDSVPESERVSLVVFSAHRAPVDALARRPGWVAITGDSSPERRRVACDLFRARLARGVAATIGAAGVAIDLSAADHAIFVDRSFVPAENLQAEDRLARVGKDRPVIVERLVSTHPLELRVQRVLDAKEALIASAVGV